MLEASNPENVYRLSDCEPAPSGDKWVAFADKFEATGVDSGVLDRLKKLSEGAFAAALERLDQFPIRYEGEEARPTAQELLLFLFGVTN